MTIQEALLAIANRDGGKITPAAVIAEARDESSVLHNSFTWDNTEAADKWRVYEAQKLIRECRVSVDRNGKKEQVIAFIGLSIDRDDYAPKNPYRLASDVANCDDLCEVAVRDVLHQLKALKARYEHLKRLQSVWDAIDSIE